ncbi:hypothetical protein RI844_11165 [Thalassotalea fonticola]|uniref:VOC domain-containing protein n=1 Tax=Thalassotalea fonticola TaxID=3065649 RepID=A0ABZ0GJ56_9GAMM|nr:hypothetical protein RI844_11165 [Colwelliaceae bacterium S1-1]
MKISHKLSRLFRNATLLVTLSFMFLTLTSVRAYAQDPTCFNNVNIEPSFIAFTTTKESKLANWYQTTFGLNIVKEFSFPDGSVTGVLMHKGEFVIEVFNRKDALKKDDFIKKAKTEQWRGVMKFGIYTNANLATLKQCLKNKGIKAGRIFKDEKLNIDLLQVIDPEQNILEIISRTNKL